MEKIKKIAPFFIIIVLVWTCYANSISGSFVFDDFYDIVDNKNIRDITQVFDFFSFRVQHRDTNYRPLGMLSFALDYYLWGLNPLGFHITNVLLHTINVFLLYTLLRLHFRIHSMNNSVYYSLLPALYFAVHPITTETVSYVKNREEMIVFFFFLLAFFLWLKSHSSSPQSSARRRWRLIILLSSLLYLTGMLTKENMVVLPAILFCYGILFLGWKGWRSMLEWGMPYYFFFLCIGILPIFFFRYYEVERLSTVNTLPQGIDIIYTIISTYIYYFRVLLLPVNQNADIHFLLYSPLANLFFVAAVGSLLFFLVKKKQIVMLFIATWFIITLSPVSNVFYFETRQIAEQRLYIPSVATALLIPILLVNIGKGKNRFFLLHILFITIFICLTINRNKVWQSPLDLWKDAALKSPDKARTHFNYAKQLIKSNLLDEALHVFQTSLALEPRSDGFNEVGAIYATKEQYDLAIFAFQKAISLAPNNTIARTNLGNLYLELQQIDRALNEFIEIFQIYSDHWYAAKMIGTIYLEKGMIDEAIDYLKKSIEINDEYSIWYLLAQAYERRQLFEQAIDAYNNAEEENESFENTLYRRGSVYLQMGRVQEAIEDLKKFVQRKPNSIEGLNNLANALVKAGKENEAIGYYIKALNLQPESSTALFNLGMTYFKLKKYHDAEQMVEKALQVAPDLTQAYTAMVEILLIQGKKEKAQKYLEKGKASGKL